MPAAFAVSSSLVVSVPARSTAEYPSAVAEIV